MDLLPIHYGLIHSSHHSLCAYLLLLCICNSADVLQSLTSCQGSDLITAKSHMYIDSYTIRVMYTHQWDRRRSDLKMYKLIALFGYRRFCQLFTPVVKCTLIKWFILAIFTDAHSGLLPSFQPLLDLFSIVTHVPIFSAKVALVAGSLQYVLARMDT